MVSRDSNWEAGHVIDLAERSEINDLELPPPPSRRAAI